MAELELDGVALGEVSAGIVELVREIGYWNVLAR
jgi:hypothetical protein